MTCLQIVKNKLLTVREPRHAGSGPPWDCVLASEICIPKHFWQGKLPEVYAHTMHLSRTPASKHMLCKSQPRHL